MQASNVDHRGLTMTLCVSFYSWWFWIHSTFSSLQRVMLDPMVMATKIVCLKEFVSAELLEDDHDYSDTVYWKASLWSVESLVISLFTPTIHLCFLCPLIWLNLIFILVVFCYLFYSLIESFVLRNRNHTPRTGYIPEQYIQRTFDIFSPSTFHYFVIGFYKVALILQVIW